ncbi:MAG: hypothetical protein QW416_01385 [Candidatus Nitrosocaldaceae archaeon]
MDEQGIILREEKIQNSIQNIQGFFANIKDAKVVMESSTHSSGGVTYHGRITEGKQVSQMDNDRMYVCP